MTAALLGVGACHVGTALGLTAATARARVALGLGGAATVLVAAFPLPATGGSTPHAVAAGVAFAALGTWPALAAVRPSRAGPPARRGSGPAWALRPAPSLTAAAVLVGLVGWFAVSLGTGGRTGLAERAAAGAQALWPLVAVLSARSAVGRGGRRGDPAGQAATGGRS
jgi:hypothetical protein